MTAGRASTAVIGTMMVGALAAVQVRLNGGLGAELGDGFAAATLSFVTGLVALGAIILCSPAQRAAVVRLRSALVTRNVPIWMMVACLGAAAAVLGQSVAASVIGVTMFSIGIIAGRSVSATLIDAIGLGPGGRRKITAGRIVGTAIALLAVGLIPLVGAFAADIDESLPVWALLFALAAGAGLAFQQAANGGLRVRSGSGIVSTCVIFAVGAVVLGGCFLARLPTVGVPEVWPSNPLLYAGGIVGAAFVVLSAVLVTRVGVLMLGLGALVGQMIAAVALDALWPTPGSPSVLLGAATVVLAIIGAVIAAEPWRAKSARTPVDSGASRN